MSHHTNLDEKLEGFDNFQAWKYRISLVLEENELDSYITEEVLVLEGDEDKDLHKNKLVMAKRIIVDSISEEVVGSSPLWFPQGKSLCLLSLVILSAKYPKIILA